MRAPIHSRKHYVQTSLTTVVAGALHLGVIADGTLPGDVNGSTEVIDGALVKAVYVELWVRTNDTSPGAFVFIVEKAGGTASNPTTGNMAALDAYENKKNVFFSSQGLTNINTSQAVPIIRQWIKIPKGKQRMGLDDKIRFVLFAQALDQNICGLVTYKEYT